MTLHERWRGMSLFRRVLLILMAAMILGFGVATPIVTSRWGIEYGDTLLYRMEEAGVCCYSGRVDGKNAVFTVSPDGTVEYQWGDLLYGPWQVVEDPTASPEGDWSALPGVEISRGNEVLFRGGYYEGSWFMLIQEDGEPLEMVEIRASTSGGTVVKDEDGRVLGEEELHAPGLSFLAKLVLAPELTHRGSLSLYMLVTLLAAFNIVQICFPALMFRLSLLGRVRDPGAAEPSDFYIAMEHLEWMVLAVLIFVFYAGSLRLIN